MDKIEKKIKKYNFKLIELSNYLDISRSTIYRYIEYYNSGNKGMLSELALEVFDIINSGSAKDKQDIILYIFELKYKKTDTTKNETLVDSIKKYIQCNPESNKTKLLQIAFTTGKLDKAIEFIMYLCPFLDENGEFIQGKLFDRRPIDSYAYYLEVLKRIDVLKG